MKDKKDFDGYGELYKIRDCPKCKGKKTYQEGACSKCGYDVD